MEKVGPIAAGGPAGDVEALAVVVNDSIGAVVGRGDVLSYSGFYSYWK